MTKIKRKAIKGVNRISPVPESNSTDSYNICFSLKYLQKGYNLDAPSLEDYQPFINFLKNESKLSWNKIISADRTGAVIRKNFQNKHSCSREIFKQVTDSFQRIWHHAHHWLSGVLCFLHSLDRYKRRSVLPLTAFQPAGKLKAPCTLRTGGFAYFLAGRTRLLQKLRLLGPRDRLVQPRRTFQTR